MPGVAEKITALRQRHHRLEASIEHYETKVAEQTAQLNKMNQPREFDEDLDEHAIEDIAPMTEEDLRKEEEEIKELESRRKELEERVNSMGRDITGVLG
jgi:chromosome segregation ATPase